MKKLRIGLVALLAALIGFQPVAAMSDEIAPSPRIIGGTTASISQVPWQVALIYRPARSDFQGQFCGGSILSSTWILTAAHCLEDGMAFRDLMVLAGTNELSTRRLNGIQAKRYILHPGWDTATNDNDVALIELLKPITLRAGRAEAISLPADRPEEEDIAVISGWGNTSNTGVVWTTLLKRASVEISSDDYCDGVYGSYSADLMVCATGPSFTTDTCQGDSGGPLAINVDGRWEIHGITSFGVGCAEAPWPGVYAEVFEYNDWISPYLLTRPTIKSLSPSSAAVGATVTISGTGFTGTTSVRLGATEIDFNQISDTQITFVVPEGSFTAQVRVENPAGFSIYSRSLTILPPPGVPEITSIGSSARIGSQVTISGRNLSSTTNVTINGVEQVFTIRSDRQIRFTVAAGTTTGKIIVTNDIGSAESRSTIRVR
jgi:secreted trypsin-like serine protease